MLYTNLKKMDNKWNELSSKWNKIRDKLQEFDIPHIVNDFYKFLIEQLSKYENEKYIAFSNFIKSIEKLDMVEYDIYRSHSIGCNIRLTNEFHIESVPGGYEGDGLRIPINRIISEKDFNTEYNNYDKLHDGILKKIRKLENEFDKTCDIFYKYDTELQYELVERFGKNKIELIIISNSMFEIVEVRNNRRLFVDSDQLRDIRQIQEHYKDN